MIVRYSVAWLLIVVRPGDFPDDASTSDHRPVIAQIWPGITYAKVGQSSAGAALTIVGRSADGEWLQLQDGTWVAAFLVDGAPANVPVVGPAPTPAPAPPAASGQGQVTITALDKRAEYADIRNDGRAPVDLAGWVLRSERGPQDCPLAGVLQPGQTLRIWAMGGDGGFSCGFGSSIWNNSEPDAAVLLGPGGVEVSRFWG